VHPARIAIVVIAGVAIVFAALLYVQTPMNPDQSIFAYIGWRAALGERLYLDVTEQNWPGAMLLHAGAITLFGAEAWSYRLFDFLVALVAGGALGVLFFDPKRDDRRIVAAIVAVSFPIAYVTADYWFAGSRDAIGANLLMIATALLALSLRTRRMAWALPVGPLFLFVVFIRPTYALFPVLLAATMIPVAMRNGVPWRDCAKRLVVVFASFAVTLGLVLALGARSGALREWWVHSVEFNVASPYTESPFFWHFIPWFSKQYAYMLPGVAFAAWIWAREPSEGFAASAFGSMSVTVLVSYAVMGKGFGYHLAGIVPVFAASNAFVFGWLIHEWQGGRLSPALRRAGVAFAVFFLVGSVFLARHLKWQFLALTGVADPSEARRALGNTQPLYEAAAYIRERTEPGDTVVSFDRLPLINYLAQRAYPFRFVSVGTIRSTVPSFSGSDPWIAEVRQALQARPPAMIAISRDTLRQHEETEPFSEGDALLRTMVEDNYEPVAEFDHIVVMKLRGEVLRLPPPDGDNSPAAVEDRTVESVETADADAAPKESE